MQTILLGLESNGMVRSAPRVDPGSDHRGTRSDRQESGNDAPPETEVGVPASPTLRGTRKREEGKPHPHRSDEKTQDS
jgi:hypothetical protein